MANADDSRRTATIFVIDDDSRVQQEVESALDGLPAICRYYSTVEAYLREKSDDLRGCIVAELRVGAMSGVELAEHLAETKSPQPIVIYSRYATTSLTVRAMKCGAISVIDKGSDANTLWEAITQALSEYDRRRAAQVERERYARLFGALHSAESLVLASIVDGRQNKEIAQTLNVSVRTVETRRRSMFRKLQIDNVPQLVRLYCDAQRVGAF